MIFIYEQSNKKNWEKIAERCQKTVSEFGESNKDFSVEIKQYRKKRSGPQLRAFWKLVEVIRGYMNDEGNNFSPETVATYFKILGGHYDVIGNEKCAKSIANKSDATVEDMRKILDAMLKFGIEESIRGCYLDHWEEEEILNSFR